jgi:hypothetical protein
VLEGGEAGEQQWRSTAPAYDDGAAAVATRDAAGTAAETAAALPAVEQGQRSDLGERREGGIAESGSETRSWACTSFFLCSLCWKEHVPCAHGVRCAAAAAGAITCRSLQNFTHPSTPPVTQRSWPGTGRAAA